MTIEKIMQCCAEQQTVLGQTLAYAWTKYQNAKTPEERSDVLEQVIWAIEEGEGHGHLVH